jgi:hypothetical protein
MQIWLFFSETHCEKIWKMVKISNIIFYRIFKHYFLIVKHSSHLYAVCHFQKLIKWKLKRNSETFPNLFTYFQIFFYHFGRSRRKITSSMFNNAKNANTKFKYFVLAYFFSTTTKKNIQNVNKFKNIKKCKQWT